MSTHKNLYQKDFYGWCSVQSEELLAGRIHNLDLLNLSEEIRDLGENKRFELVNALALLFMHILKWKYQADRRTRSWENTINHRRMATKRILKRNPGLKAQVSECASEAYEDARYSASEETQLPLEIFPEEIPFSYEDVLAEGWLPE